MSNKTVLIFGSGAIGSHLGYCLSSSGMNIDFIARGNHYEIIKKKGLLIKIYENKKLLKKKILKENEKIKLFSNLNEINKNKKYDYIFIMNKLSSIKLKDIKIISKFINKKTSIIPQCTQVPFWLNTKIYFNKKKNNRDVNFIYKKFFLKKQIIGMSAWVSAKIEKPGTINVKHIQRGYPLKEITSYSKKSCDYLRKKLRKFCISPNIKNITSELFIKSLNALAFNLVALNTLKNNKKLYQDITSLNKIHDIMNEGDQYLKLNKIKIPQSITSRIKQTLSSTEHTMSMLSDHLSGKKSEIEYVWESYNNLMESNSINIEKTKKIYYQTIKDLK